MADAGDPANCPAGHRDTVKLMPLVAVGGRAGLRRRRRRRAAGAAAAAAPAGAADRHAAGPAAANRQSA